MAQTGQQVAEMGQTVAQAAQLMAAPKRIVRDERQRAIGVEVMQ
jgi:hypothetical protein